MGQLAKEETAHFLDDEGFLKESFDWSEDVAQKIAKKEGIDELSQSKMEIINFMRHYYKKFDSFPILNYVCRNVHQPRECVNQEFIDPMKAWKIAGLPKMEKIFFFTHDGKNYKPNPFY